MAAKIQKPFEPPSCIFENFFPQNMRLTNIKLMRLKIFENFQSYMLKNLIFNRNPPFLANLIKNVFGG
jgi:hypothetical protein